MTDKQVKVLARVRATLFEIAENGECDPETQGALMLARLELGELSFEARPDLVLQPSKTKTSGAALVAAGFCAFSGAMWLLSLAAGTTL